MSMSPNDVALYRAVDEVLHYVWDPIGVSSVPEARDEYHAYLPQVFGLVRGGNDVKIIAEHLTRITVDRMGIAPRPEHDRGVAEVLLDWKRVNDQLHSE